MRFAFFLGCTTPSRLKAYESSSRAVLDAFGITLVDVPQFNCCGYPLKNVDLKASLLSTARNLALAEKEDLHMLSLCKCGYGTFKLGAHMLKQDPELKNEINTLLIEEGLCYSGTRNVFHLLTVLHKNVGLEKIKKHVTTHFKDLKIATHYGCHALRPSEIVEFDDPVSPTVFDQLVTATGASSIPWTEKLACCGSPLEGIHDTLSTQLTDKKITSAQQAGADFIATACPFCHIQLETVLEESLTSERTDTGPRPLLYSQLLGFSMGINRGALGLNNGDGDKLKGFVDGH